MCRSVSFARIFMCHWWVSCDAHGVQKRVLDPLELELWVVVSLPVGGCWKPNLGLLQEQHVFWMWSYLLPSQEGFLCSGLRQSASGEQEVGVGLGVAAAVLSWMLWGGSLGTEGELCGTPCFQPSSWCCLPLSQSFLGIGSGSHLSPSAMPCFALTSS